METRKAKTKVVAAVLALAALCVFSLFAVGGNLEPSAPPAPTMKTLDEVPPTWSQILPASERFELVMGGEAVLDKETGLVWEQSPDTTTRNWYMAIQYCYKKTIGGRKGWRLPTVEELASLVDPSQTNPALPSGHPFSNVQAGGVYWSSSTDANNTSVAYLVGFYYGGVGVDQTFKSQYRYVWCVRGGYGYDAY